MSVQKPCRGVSRAIVVSLILLLAGPAQALSPNPDLTAPGAIAALKADSQSSPPYASTYNLGPSGLRGWIYIDRANKGQQGLMTDLSRQILVTHVGTGTPAVGVLAVDDVILGVAWGSGGDPVANFDSDCRKSFGRALGEAEKSENSGILRLKRWRAGTTTDVQITLPVMGAYSETAPYDCPKSASILAAAIPILQAETLTSDWKGAVSALALLSTGDSALVPAVQTLARSLSNASTTLQTGRGLDTWKSGHIAILLAEYYLTTGDTQVLPGIHNYSVALARSQSLYGTFGHKGSMLKSDGAFNGSIPWYGPINSAGVPANLGIVLGKKAILASGGLVAPEIDPAIARAADFFSYFVNKGGIPYGEHEPYIFHADNGKAGAAALMFALMGNKPEQTKYYSRFCISTHVGEEFGHTGQGFSFLWTALGAHAGGAGAGTAFLKEVRWHRDLARRANGSFSYDGQEQYGGSSVNNYWAASSYYGLSPTATYVLQLTLPLRKLCITGKEQDPGNPLLDSAAVANAVWAGRFSQERTGYTTAALLDALGEYDPVVRDAAARTLGTRSGEFATLRPQLITMAEDPADANKREAACHALGFIGGTTAMPPLGRRLSDPIPWVRYRAAEALGRQGSAALPQINTMLTAFVANAPAPGVIDWSDPIQNANGILARILFNTAPFRTSVRSEPLELFHQAVRVGLAHPDGWARGQLSNLLKQDLGWADVQALAPGIVEAVKERSPADQMFSEAIRDAGLETLAKFKVEEGLPLCLMVKEQNWHSDNWKPFQVLRDSYTTSAAEVLPTLYDWQAHLPAFKADPSISAARYANLESYINSTIAALEAPTPAPTLNYFKTIDIISATPLDINRVQLTAAATDLDGGVPRYLWSRVSGPGNVVFSENNTTTSATTVATFEIPGTYVLRVSITDSSILNAGVWTKPVLGYVDFQTYNRSYAAVRAHETVAIDPGSWPPVAYGKSVITGVDTPRALTLVGYDYQGGPLDHAIVTPPTHGTLTGSWPNFIYTPNSGYQGGDSFVFTVTGSGGLTSSQATVAIQVHDPLVVHVNFNGYSGTGAIASETESTLSGPADGLGTRWNQFAAASSFGTLINAAGAATPVAVATTATEGRTWGNPSLKMLRSGLTHFDKGTDTTVTITGLAPGAAFDLWLTSHASNNPTADRAHGIWSTTNPTTSPNAQTINGVTTLNGSTWVAGNNHVRFDNVVADGTGEIVFLGDASDAGEYNTNAYRLPLNGIQLATRPRVLPVAPAGLAATPGDTVVRLAWDPVPDATGYLVKRAATAGGPYLLRANPATPQFLDAPAANGQTWYYVISAVNPHGEGSPSAEVSAMPVGLLPPAPPTGLTAMAGEGPVNLSWNAADTATRYHVKRGIQPGGPYLVLASPTATIYQDDSAFRGMTWYYVVSAENGSGEGSNSDEVSAVLPSLKPLINVNFNGYTGASFVGSETELTLTGPAGALGSIWNQFAAASSGSGTLVDATGAGTSVRFATTATEGRTWGDPSLKMLRSALTHFSKGANTTLTISGLTAGGFYHIWLASHANNTTTAERAHGIWSTTRPTSSASAQTINGLSAHNGATWEIGNNHVLFENVEADTTGKIVFLGDATDAGELGTGQPAYRLPLNGFQIREPGSIPPSAFRVWAADPARGLAPGVNDGPLDAPGGDGVANLLKFVLGGHPFAHPAGLMPTLTPANALWVFEYDRSNPSAPPATTQILEYGNDLVGWTSLLIPATSSGPVTVTPGTPSARIRVALPDLGPSGFARLKVSE